MISRQHLLPGVPLIESPLFDAQLDAMGLTSAEREVAVQLNLKGYAVIDFPDPLIGERIDRIKQRLTPQLGIDLNDSESIKTGERRVQDAWKFDEDVRSIAANSEVLALLGKLYGRSAFPFQTLNFPVGTQQEPHTDSVHFSSIPERFMCGVWLAMEDIGPDAGPLCYVPGSHRWPILTNAMVGRRGWGDDNPSAQAPYEETWRAIVAAKGLSQETFEARKGQALIWCANLLHGGSRQHDPRLTRWSQVTHYFFDNCVYYTPSYSDEYLGRLALRHIVNAADGAEKPNLYLGERIEAAGPKRRQSLVRRWLGRVRRALRG
jgi:ectoine hydroxylase-related dioxygenase (phytanoyl-CoA dioxygenase family)